MTASSESLESTIERALARQQGRTCGSFPARIVSFDPTTQMATVQPVVRFRRRDVDTEEIVWEKFPEITGCPVRFPSTALFQMTFPLNVGDACIVHVAERSIDDWLTTGAADVTPTSVRRFSLNDAWVEPGLRPTTSALSMDPTCMQIGEDTGMRISIGGGMIKFEAPAGEVLATVDNALAELETILTDLNTGFIAVAAGPPATPVTNGTLTTFFASFNTGVLPALATLAAARVTLGALTRP